jgi:hypothetical protein
MYKGKGGGPKASDEAHWAPADFFLSFSLA